MAATPDNLEDSADWHRRVVGRSLRTARERSIDRGAALVRAAATLLERSNGGDITVQDVADEAGQSLRTLYQYFESKDDLLLAVFEEAMRAWAQLVRDAVADLDDPLERLAGALLTAVRLPEHTNTGVSRGLARLRLKLAGAEPELIGRSQAPITALLRELVAGAAAADRIPDVDPESATFFVLTASTAAITASTLGNDVGVHRPDAIELVAFCLRGLGATITTKQLVAIGKKVHMPTGVLGLSAAPRPARRAPRASKKKETR